MDLRSASTVMQMQVVATGIVIAEWDRTARQEFEMHTSSAYALLNENAPAFLMISRREDRSMADDVLLNKANIIERCLQRIEDEYDDDPANLHDNLTRQDSIILNLQRACQATIDLAMHLVREHGLGVPQESRDAFTLLRRAGGT